MKTKHLLLFGLVVAFSSCGTAYRSGQTPDDVYYSPAPPQNTYVKTANQEEKDSYAYNNTSSNEDLEIRRGIRDSRYRDNNAVVTFGYGGYNSFGYNPDNYDSYGYNSYGYNSYGYNGYGHNGYNNFYNPYNGYSSNFYVSPYYNYYYAPQVYYTTSGGSRTIAPRRYNLGGYNNTSNARTPGGYRPEVAGAAPVRTITTTPVPANNGTGVGNVIRRVFRSDNSSNDTRVYRSDNSNNNNNNNTNSSPVRSTQTSSGSNNSSSGSSSSAPVRTFRK